MKLISIINELKKKLGTSNKENWISERLKEIEEHKKNFDSVPFKIVKQKDSGFLAKIKGLYSFISFYHMPWKYLDLDSWTAIAPYLIGKIFFCKIHKIGKDPISIFLDGKIPQFKKSELIVGHEYKGLIIKISNFGLFIDIGYHFDWKCGSLIGLLHKSELTDNEKISNFQIGQEITTFLRELNNNGQPVFCNDDRKINWILGKPQELVGQIVWAKVVRQTETDGVEIWVNGKYKAVLTIDKQAYAPQSQIKIKKATEELKHGEIINCEVTGFSEKFRYLNANWLVETNTDLIFDNSILIK